MTPSEKPKNSRLRVVSGRESNTEPSTGENSEAIAEDSACPLCFGTGMEVVTGVGGGRARRRCRCQTPDQQLRLFRAANIPPRYHHCTIQDYDAGDTKIESAEQTVDGRAALSQPRTDSEAGLTKWKAKTAAQTIVDHYLELDGRGLLLIGPVGVGKTHLATAILRALIERYKISGLFYSFDSLLKEIQGSYNSLAHASEFKLLQPVFDAEVLVLDELGISKPTDWVKDTLMYIINTRYNDKRLTIFTTNFSDQPRSDRRLAELKEQLKKLEDRLMLNETTPETEMIKREIAELTSERLEERIGARLRSRLYEMCKTVIIEGEDFRKMMAK